MTPITQLGFKIGWHIYKKDVEPALSLVPRSKGSGIA